MTRHIHKATPPIGVVIDPPMWDSVKGVAITQKGEHCKRCLAKPSQGCWQHKVHAGEEVVAYWSPESILQAGDGSEFVLGEFPEYHEVPQ